MTDTEKLQRLIDKSEITEVLGNYAAGLDAQDWDLWRSIFLDEVVFDLTSWSGGETRLQKTDKVVPPQAALFAELSMTQHFIAIPRITIEGDRARALAAMRAEHWIEFEPPEGTGRYTMFGFYDDKLVRTDQGWKISEMQLNVTHTEGNRWVFTEARRRMKAKREAQK